MGECCWFRLSEMGSLILLCSSSSSSSLSYEDLDLDTDSERAEEEDLDDDDEDILMGSSTFVPAPPASRGHRWFLGANYLFES